MVDATTSHSPPTQHHQLPFSRHPLSITTPNFDATRVSVFRVTKQIFPQLSPSLSTFSPIKVTVDRQTTPHLIPDHTCSFQTPELRTSLHPQTRIPGIILEKQSRNYSNSANGQISNCLSKESALLPPNPASRQLLKLQTPAHHESLTHNRQLACRECSHILRRFSTTWKGPISYRWRG